MVENNVLYEPVMPIHNDFDEAMDDSASMHTNVGSKAYEKGGGIAVTDMKLLKAEKIRCCMCGVMTNPNAANTCINCLKS